MGVTAGVPPRVEAGVKAALLGLVDYAVGEGWTAARACVVLELGDCRLRRWRRRREIGRLHDGAGGGVAVHAIMPSEQRAILEVFDRWGDIDGGYRKLAHRGSYEKLVWVSPSTVYRVLAAHGLVLPAQPQRTPAPARPMPGWERHQIWIYDITHFPRAGRVAYAIMDVVTRKWLAVLVTVEESATQVEVVFTDTLDTEGLWPRVEARQTESAKDSDNDPILLAMSDNGPQTRAGTTREFFAMCSIAARFGRPGTPTDQAWIETLFATSKRNDPTSTRSPTPPNCEPTPTSYPATTTTDAYTPPSDTSPPTTNTKAEENASTKPDETASPEPASPESPTIPTTNPTSHEHTHPKRRNQNPKNGHLLRSTSVPVGDLHWCIGGRCSPDLASVSRPPAGRSHATWRLLASVARSLL